MIYWLFGVPPDEEHGNDDQEDDQRGDSLKRSLYITRGLKGNRV